MRQIITALFLLLSVIVSAQKKVVRTIGFGGTTIYVYNYAPAAPTTNGLFSFTISGTKTVSAGVYKNDSILVRTLWSTEQFTAGTYYVFWDGKDDYGTTIPVFETNYKVKVLSNAVQYTWQGTIGNTSDNMTGATKHRGYYHCMRGLAFNGSYGYFCTGYSEGSPSFAKFNTSTPNQKIEISTATGTAVAGDINYVATDGTNVYWAAFDSYASNISWIFGTKVTDDTFVPFSTGTSYSLASSNVTYTNCIATLNQANSRPSGLAVQKTQNHGFIARGGINQLVVFNKITGETEQTLTYTNPRALAVDTAGNLWMVTGTNTVAKYSVNSNGTLNAAILTLSGLIDPLAVGVSQNNVTVSVADGSTSQQVKFYSNSTGSSTSTLGTAGGYASDATVSNSKFYFNDARSNKLPFIAFQSDGSYWVNDAGNSRVQHYNSSNTYINRVMSLGSTYSAWADRNNINKVFAHYMEFDIDYSVQTLTGTTGWTLTKNWGANVTTDYDDFTLLKYQTTLSNGRTYAFIRNGSFWELVELPSSGTMRFTGVSIALSKILCSDGSLQDAVESGLSSTFNRYALTGFDGSFNPIWSGTAELLAVGVSDTLAGSPNSFPATNQLFSTSTNKVVLFNPGIYARNNAYGVNYNTNMHLGIMGRGQNNNYLSQTEKGTHRNYQGEYPKAGYFDNGNIVSVFAGGIVNIVDRNIITSYHGEFWKNGQTNMYNHYYDNGLALGQFGTNRDVIGLGVHAAALMAGNALSPVVVKDGSGDLYLWHGDESDHAGIHRWKITGLNTITEQVMTILAPTTYADSALAYVDLLATVPFNDTMANNTGGWTRTQLLNDGNFSMNSSRLQYKKNMSPDLHIGYGNGGLNATSATKSLGVNNVVNDWGLTGKIAYPDNFPNYGEIRQYFEIVDDAGKVLTVMYPELSYPSYPTITESYLFNGQTVGTYTGLTRNVSEYIKNVRDFSIVVVAGVVTFTYGNYTPVVTTISDGTGNWRKPTTLIVRFENVDNNYPVYGAIIDLYEIHFDKDVRPIPN